MVYFCFRDTTDWGNKSISLNDDFWTGTPHRRRRSGVFLKYLDAWNQHLSMDWFDFRRELKEISRLCFQKAGIPEIELGGWQGLNDDDWLIPIDDDDWVAPYLKETLESAGEDFLLSGCAVYRPSIPSVTYRANKGKTYSSCGYAVRSKALKSMAEKESVDMLRFHGRVRPLVNEYDLSTKYVKMPLYCALKHCGRATHMWHEHNFQEFQQNPKVVFPEVKVRKYVQWIEPYKARVMKLGKRLHWKPFL